MCLCMCVRVFNGFGAWKRFENSSCRLQIFAYMQIIINRIQHSLWIFIVVVCNTFGNWELEMYVCMCMYVWYFPSQKSVMNKFADALLLLLRLLFSLQLDPNSNKVFVDWRNIAPIASTRTHISRRTEKTFRFLLSHTHILCFCSTLSFFLSETEAEEYFNIFFFKVQTNHKKETKNSSLRCKSEWKKKKIVWKE